MRTTCDNLNGMVLLTLVLTLLACQSPLLRRHDTITPITMTTANPMYGIGVCSIQAVNGNAIKQASANKIANLTKYHMSSFIAFFEHASNDDELARKEHSSICCISRKHILVQYGRCNIYPSLYAVYHNRRLIFNHLT